MRRREFIRSAAATITTALAPSAAALAARRRGSLVGVKPVEQLPGDVERPWLGPSFWANRLQDWRLSGGRIECLRREADFEARTVALITRFFSSAHKAGRISATVGMIDGEGEGFCGFLLATGRGGLDYRASALVHSRAGENGGFMAVVDQNGRPSFRDFSSPDAPLGFERVETDAEVASDEALGYRSLRLDCHIDPVADGRYDVRLESSDADSGEPLGFAVRTNLPAEELAGGVSLVASAPPGEAGARWWLSDIGTGGAKISEHPERACGPVIGCLHSLNRGVLKLTAQYMPISAVEQQRARLDWRQAETADWQEGPVAMIEPGYVAAFRVDDWDAEKSWHYRVVDPDADEAGVAQFSGRVRQDPGTSRPLRIALYSCLIPVSRSLDDLDMEPLNRKETAPGRFTPDNVLFPHERLVRHCDSHEPDLYVFCGDQYYESFPTRFGRHTPDAALDTLYRWYLWYWTFRDSVRDRPAIVLADDHDILQGNVWGNAGVGSEQPKEEDGGYKWDKEIVRMVFRMQQGANPDPYDPTPVRFGIPAGYGEFVYGGVSFAFVEDRKWKSPPDYESDPLEARGELLGARQEAFLEHWAGTHGDLPKVCLTASIWGVPQTAGDLKPLLDYDANGYPPDGRNRAVALVRDANALVLAGDQHLGMIAQQGLDDFDDGALFFAGPAAASFWQRWFEGEGRLDNRRGDDPNTGDFVDCFGNRMRVLAVANPNMSWSEFSDGQVDWRVSTSDRSIPSEGYGIVRVDQSAGTALLECWPRDVDPEQGEQFAGWPYLHHFSAARR